MNIPIYSVLFVYIIPVFSAEIKMSIGPALPPHLQHLRRGAESDSEEDEGEVGPRLPEVPCRGPAPPPHGT